MPVFDFSSAPVDKEEAVCTYTTFKSNNSVPSGDKPIMVLDNSKKKWNIIQVEFYQIHVKELHLNLTKMMVL